MAVMNKSELYEWAKLGLNSAITECYKEIQQANKNIIALEEGKEVKTRLTAEELREIITKNKKEIGRLVELKFDLSWDLAVNGEE